MGSVPSFQIQNKEEGSTFGSEYMSHGEIQLLEHVYRAPGQTAETKIILKSIMKTF